MESHPPRGNICMKGTLHIYYTPNIKKSQYHFREVTKKGVTLMTEKEIKEAFLKGAPVKYVFGNNEENYAGIIAVIYRKVYDKLILKAVLGDSTGRCTIELLPKYVHPGEDFEGREEALRRYYKTYEN